MKDDQPLGIDLFCGLGGWTEGMLAEGYSVVGFDIERHDYGDGKRYPAKLVIQDVLTIHGRQFKDADLIVASPPCQEYSYMAMPWSKSKQMVEEYQSGKRDVKKLTALFDACFRIQSEAIEAAGRCIPLIVENVRGAQRWVGRARWNYGSYYLWGDVPALMPITSRRISMKQGITHRANGETNFHQKNNGGSSGQKELGCNPVHEIAHLSDAVKVAGLNWRPLGKNELGRKFGSKSNSRKAASAQIAKIPFPLARWIAHVWKPKRA